MKRMLLWICAVFVPVLLCGCSNQLVLRSDEEVVSIQFVNVSWDKDHQNYSLEIISEPDVSDYKQILADLRSIPCYSRNDPNEYPYGTIIRISYQDGSYCLIGVNCERTYASQDDKDGQMCNRWLDDDSFNAFIQKWIPGFAP